MKMKVLVELEVEFDLDSVGVDLYEKDKANDFEDSKSELKDIFSDGGWESVNIKEFKIEE